MKRIISFILVVCLVLGLLAGISFSVFAAPATIEITGVTAPAVGQALTADGITGAPEGFALAHAYWEKYDYTEGSFVNLDQPDEAAVKGVYRLYMYFDSTGGSFTYDDEDLIAAATVNGETTDEYNLVDNEHEQIVAFSLSKLFIAGNIELIDVVTIEQLPAVQAGVSTDLSNIVLPENAPYEFHRNTAWLRYGEESPVGATLEEGYEYGLWVYLQPKEGYWFHPMARFDVPMEPSFTMVSPTGYVDVDFTYDLRLRVDEINLSCDADPVLGEAAVNPTVTIENDPGFTVEAQWHCIEQGDWTPMEPGDRFAYGEYANFITITAPAGYEMDWDVPVYVDGTPIDEVPNMEIWDRYDGEIILLQRFELVPPNGFVNSIFLGVAPGSIAPGEAITAPTLDVIEGEVTISNIQWVDADYQPITGKFEDGKVYYLEITMAPQEGYAIRSDYCIEIEKENRGFYHPWVEVSADGTGVTYLEYSLLPEIDKVEITVTVPQIGAAPAEPKVPAGAKYTIDYFNWYSMDSDEEVVKFQDNKKYILDLGVTAAEGYRLAEDLTILLNGEEPWQYGNGEVSGWLTEAFSFKKAIDRVDVTIPELKLGDALKLSDIKIPQGAKYFVNTSNSAWHAETTEFNGTVEKDKYSLELYLDPAEGYEFTQDTQVYLNGEPMENLFWIYESGTTVELRYIISFRDSLNKIELPTLPDVAVGDTAAKPQIEAPDGAKYSISADWVKMEDAYSPALFEGAFEDKNFYYLGIEIQADQGYEFADGTVVTIGGKAHKGIAINAETSMFVYVLYNFGMQVIDTIELTVETPADGKNPAKPTVSKDAPYEVVDCYWFAGESEYMDQADTLYEKDTFAYGNYYWLTTILKAKDGYIFSDEVTIKINGEAVTPISMESMPVAMGNGALFANSLGLLAKPVTPPSGDNAPVVALAILAVLALAGMAVVLIGKKKLVK